MKKSIIYFAFISFLGAASTIYSTSPQTPSNQIENMDRAKRLNIILEKELIHLEELNSTLQYLGQAINKGSIKVENSEQTRNWIRDHQKIVSDLQTQCATQEPTEQTLGTTLLTIKELGIHVTETMNNQFRNTLLFEPSMPPRSSLTTPSFQQLEKVAKDNEQIIFNLKEHTKIAGLSAWNLFARRLDDINNKYHVTTFVENIPLMAVLAGGALYFTPQKWADKVPFLGNAKKNWVGDFWADAKFETPNQRLDKVNTDITDFSEKETRKKANGEFFYDEKKREYFLKQIKQLDEKRIELELTIEKDGKGAGNDEGYFSKAYNFIKSNDGFINSLKILSPALLLFKKESIPGYMATKRSIRNLWNKFKGYDGETKSNTPQDHITLDDPRLIGLDGQIDELRNLVRYVTDPEMYDRTNTSLEKGVLLIGPSRCGKTLAARALRDTINDVLEKKGVSTKYGFKEVKWGEVTWSDEGLKNVIEEAKFNAPCVIFFDEIHTIPLQTDKWGGAC